MTRRFPMALVVMVLYPFGPAAFAQEPVTAGSPTSIPATVGGGGVTSGPPTAPLSSFGEAVKGLPKDIWRSVTFDTAKIAGVGLGASLAAHHTDVASLEEFQESLRFRDLVRPGNTYGSFAVQAGGAVGAYLIGRWTGHSKLTAAGLDVIRAQVVTQAWVQTLKLSANRQRPDGTRFSFPSGHVASSFATAGIVQREFGWKVALPFYGLGTYVASARMAQNHHYLSDVIFGASIGLASAHSLQIRSGNHALAVSPGAVGSGIGVNFRLVNRH